MAIKIALHIARMGQDVIIRSDSKYAISCSTEWPRRWRLKSWKKAQGVYKENTDLIEGIEHRIPFRDILKAKTEFVWVKGHAGDPGNEAADKLAVKGSHTHCSHIRISKAQYYSTITGKRGTKQREETNHQDVR